MARQVFQPPAPRPSSLAGRTAAEGSGPLRRIRNGFGNARSSHAALCLLLACSGGALLGSEERTANHLAGQTSPYLLQHVYNPVDWHPWGEEAFAKARQEGKMIFLSIGYSTCHWCHVMERESFEDEDIAALLNKHFVSIKVDREERPDVDRIYMAFVQATTGGGGWPLNVWLTPELEPVVGGTYFPPEDGLGRPGFPSVLEEIARLWELEPERLKSRGSEVIRTMKTFFSSPDRAGGLPGEEAIEAAYRRLAGSYDPQHGGFGPAPKFPRPVQLGFLFRYSVREGAPGDQREKARAMALHTLDRMAAGGMHDHLGGGFHRYSVDRFWHVPHFEKMLYDQAQIAMAALDAWQLTGQERYRRLVRGILGYVLRDLTSPAGGFYSAEDADSLFEHGKEAHGEGAFYVWRKEDIEQLLDGEKARRFMEFYGVRQGGNAPEGSDPRKEFTGLNILHSRLGAEEAARRFGIPPGELEKELEESRGILLLERAKRPRPLRDDKIIVSWNGLMISAMARAGRALGDGKYIEEAAAAASFVRQSLSRDGGRKLLRIHRGEASGIGGFADDYAFLIQGLLDLYEATFDTRWIRWAIELQETQDQLFWDQAHGGYFSTTGKDPSILIRLKEDYDGAEPSPNSVAAMNLLRLSGLTGRKELRERAEGVLSHFARSLEEQPGQSPAMLCALGQLLEKPRQIVLASEGGEASLDPFLSALGRAYLPGRILIHADGGEHQEYLAASLPFLEGIRPLEGRATAYVCEDYVCQAPTTDPEEFARQIGR